MIKLNKMVKNDKKLYESNMRYIRFTKPAWTVYRLPFFNLRLEKIDII